MIEGEQKIGERQERELRFAELYKSPEWKKLSPIDRAELLLVAEGVKDGVFIGGDFTNFRKVIEKMGLEARLNTPPSFLEPVYTVSTPEKLSAFLQKLILAKGTTEGTSAEIIHRINGEFLGYPPCCIDEYINPKRHLEERKNYPPSISNFDYEMMQMQEKGEKYPEGLDYCPLTFTPCSAHCEKALEKLKEWKEVIQKADLEAARALKSLNWHSEPYRIFHEQEIENMREEWWEKRKIEFLRESILGPEAQSIERREAFLSYLKDLGLEEGELKGKRILDIGAGEGYFGAYLKEKGISDKVVNLDIKPEIGEEVKDKNTVQARAEDLPFREGSFDIIVSHNAVPEGYKIEENENIQREKIQITFSEAARVLKPGGEARFGISKSSSDKPWMVQFKKILEEEIEKFKLQNPSLHIEVRPLYKEMRQEYIKDDQGNIVPTGEAEDENSVIIIRKEG